MGLLLGIILILTGLAVFTSAKTIPDATKRIGPRILSVVMLIFGAMAMLSAGVVVVDAGKVGIVKTFGRVSNDQLGEGLHVINPVSTLERISVRTQEYTMSSVNSEGAQNGDDSIRTLSKDGLLLPVDVTITYRAEPNRIAWLFRNIGTEEDFVAKIIRPAARASVRDAVSTFSAQEAYSTKREALAVSITKGLEGYIQSILSKNEKYPGDAFIIQQVLVRNIELPEGLKQSIEAKLKAEQDALRMQYVLQKEQQEADRKRIEAKGIADFQTIVSANISDKLLQWKGIEATQELAKSTNSKVVIIGSGKSGLPVILNTDSMQVSAGK